MKTAQVSCFLFILILGSVSARSVLQAENAPGKESTEVLETGTKALTANVPIGEVPLKHPGLAKDRQRRDEVSDYEGYENKRR